MSMRSGIGRSATGSKKQFPSPFPMAETSAPLNGTTPPAAAWKSWASNEPSCSPRIWCHPRPRTNNPRTRPRSPGSPQVPRLRASPGLAPPRWPPKARPQKTPPSSAPDARSIQCPPAGQRPPVLPTTNFVCARKNIQGPNRPSAIWQNSTRAARFIHPCPTWPAARIIRNCPRGSRKAPP